MYSMMDIPTEIAGRLEAGNYTIILDAVNLREKVVSIFSESLNKDMMKAIRNKEKSQLTDEQIRYVDTVDLGADGVFDSGQPRPRYQNQVQFVWHEKDSGKSFNNNIYGGPKLNTKLIAFLKQIIDFNSVAMAGKPMSEYLPIGSEFTATVKVEGDYNNLDIKTIRKVGLAPLKTEEGAVNGPTNAQGYTVLEQALLDYLMGAGKGMDAKDISQLHTKGIVVNGIALNDFGPIASAWNSLKAKVKQFKNADGKIEIVL